MALHVEDGTGSALADAYMTLDVCDAYHAAQGNSAWVVSVDNVSAREAAIRKGTAVIDSMYGGRFRGRRLLSDQSLAWPREGACDDDGYPMASVPACVRNAACEAALRVFQGVDMLPDLERGGAVVSESIGGVSITYASGAPAGTRYCVLDALLRRCLVHRGVSVVRG